ncbi:LOW QUALITY PROTEIN: importin alpha-related [Schistosoma mansoni]|uniref:importin alpha-related n=1 Tax=Schistosoma mansoni TaxID=6183 RepID=UPI00022DCB6D|nr:LOW QUALITY PROTEIN: importin alpha-related [Schistosoma mansoni]|eukprot:XP_018654197.1 LOW QUALITY PROTEIN: importin alpha-related [Schistosoma mansoni]
MAFVTSEHEQSDDLFRLCAKFVYSDSHFLLAAKSGNLTGVMERSRLYKNKDKDAEELRRRRTDQSVELRKAKKDEQLQKRRNILLTELDETSPLKEKQVDTPEHVNYDAVIRDMQSNDRVIRFKAVQLCRKTLSRAKNPPIDEFYKRGAVEILGSSLSSTHDDLVFEAAWALTNIASGDSSHTAAVVSSGTVPKLVRLLSHSAISIAEQSVWALSNIAGDGSKFRDIVIESGVVEPVLKLLDRVWKQPTVVSNVAWMLSNLCRNRDPPPPRAVIKKLLPVLNRLLQYEGNKNVVVDTAWALSYASDAVNEFIDDIIESGCVPLLLRLLASSSSHWLVIGTDEQTQAILDAGLLTYVPALLNNEKSTVVKEACWVVSNITAGSVDQIDMVISHNVMPCILEILYKGEFRTQKEACWVISNYISGGTPAQCAYLLNQNVLKALCNILTVSESKVVLMVLEGIKKLLEISDQYGQLEPACIELETCGGLDKLEGLQDHSNVQVYQIAYDLIEKYFNDADDENESKVVAGDGTENNETFPQNSEQEFRFIAPDGASGQGVTAAISMNQSSNKRQSERACCKSDGKSAGRFEEIERKTNSEETPISQEENSSEMSVYSEYQVTLEEHKRRLEEMEKLVKHFDSPIVNETIKSVLSSDIKSRHQQNRQLQKLYNRIIEKFLGIIDKWQPNLNNLEINSNSDTGDLNGSNRSVNESESNNSKLSQLLLLLHKDIIHLQTKLENQPIKYDETSIVKNAQKPLDFRTLAESILVVKINLELKINKLESQLNLERDKIHTEVGKLKEICDRFKTRGDT